MQQILLMHRIWQQNPHVDNATSSGGQLTLEQPDGSPTTDGALQTFTTATTITDAIDDLNETIENIATILLLRKLILQDWLRCWISSRLYY